MPSFQAVIILGAPGAGKGTQANLLAEKFAFYHLETGKIIRSRLFKERAENAFVEVEGKKYFWAKEKEVYQSGKLNSPPFVFHLIKEKTKEIFEAGQGIVFSGSPRILLETQKLMPLLESLIGRENIKIFFLALDIEASVWRNSHRRVCELIDHSLLYNNETKALTKCPLDGSKLIKRILDNEETIKKRFAVFEEQTLPIIGWLENNDFRVVEIDGRPSVAEVFADLLGYLDD